MTGIAEMFADLTWRVDEVQAALEISAAHKSAVSRERAALERWKQQSPHYLAKRRAYMNTYRAAHPDVRAAAVARTAAWRKANRERARANSRKHEQRRRERAKTDPVFREKYLRIRRESRRRQRVRGA